MDIPSLSQMKIALQRPTNPYELQSIGVNEAPNMQPKAYMDPNPGQNHQGFVPPGGVSTSQGLPIGGVDTNKQQPGQQLMPQIPQPPQQPQQPGQPPQGGAPGMPPGMPPAGPQGAPSAGPSAPPPPGGMGGNILQMTPQGQTLNAINPNQTNKLASGGQPKIRLEAQMRKDLDDMMMADGGSKRITKRQQTVKNAQRMAFPGIYGDPREIAATAASRVAEEDPALKQLFGVNRAELYEQAKGREGNLLGALPYDVKNPKGAAAAEGVMNKRNEQRLLDVLEEAGKHQGLVHGMDPWYHMDPMFQRMVQLIGLDAAREEYRKMNALIGMSSAGSEVNTEIPRGSAAYLMHKLGRFNEFVEHGGKRSPDRPAELGETPGHAYHKTSHVVPMKQFLEHGSMQMESPKVPMYIEASGVPEIGFQTRTPVGDAHWSRAVGLADTRAPQTRKGKEIVPGASVTNPEMTSLAPWWREKIAGKLGLESVPAQARAWGAFSPQTGVTTPIGAPKLELIAKQIMHTAKRLGVSPETARDMVLMGKERMGYAEGGEVTDDKFKKHKKKDKDRNMDTIRLEITLSKKAK